MELAESEAGLAAGMGSFTQHLQKDVGSCRYCLSECVIEHLIVGVESPLVNRPAAGSKEG